MSLHNKILIGHANGDVHFIQVMDSQHASTMATQEAQEIGKLTNAGFRTVVASCWMQDETKTAGLRYAAAWNENAVEILLHEGDRIATSHELYARCFELDQIGLTTPRLIQFCRQLKIQ